MTAFGCKGSTIILRSGKYFDLQSPNPEQFTIEDIAGALSKICRFGGHVPRYYSVSEHCCHCHDAAIGEGESTNTVLAALLHDAAEAFVGDVVKPLKQMLDGYSLIESAIESVIGQKYGIEWTYETSRTVKRIDMEMLIAERLSMFGDDGEKWTGQDQVAMRTVFVQSWSPCEAEAEFLQRAYALGVKGGA